MPSVHFICGPALAHGGYVTKQRVLSAGAAPRAIVSFAPHMWISSPPPNPRPRVRNVNGVVTSATYTFTVLPVETPPNFNIVLANGAGEVAGPIVPITMSRDPAGAVFPAFKVKYEVKLYGGPNTLMNVGSIFLPSDSPSVNTVSHFIYPGAIPAGYNAVANFKFW